MKQNKIFCSILADAQGHVEQYTFNAYNIGFK